MHIHILGICGTFMGGIALIAKSLGHTVTGSDQHVYPPMSTQLEEAGITLMQGYEPEHLEPRPDVVVIGNAMSRGNAAVEAVLNNGLRYTSGPQWLAEHVLQDQWVLAVAGTHGKTTTSSMLAWILEYAGLKPGFLIGGVPGNFGVSSRTGDGSFFVVEADEYDTAFFDKRSKFVHYHPNTLVLNNLEFDHADIFDDLAQIQRQFHHLVRTVPGNGKILVPNNDEPLAQVIEMGCWSTQESFALEGSGDWSVSDVSADGSSFTVCYAGEKVAALSWPLTGMHNVSNALAAIAAAQHAGVPAAQGVAALCDFANVKRRMELRGSVNSIRLFDDFAHHPTAISTTLHGLRANVGDNRILAVLEPRSNTMRLGIHADQLGQSLREADQSFVLEPGDLNWDLAASLSDLEGRVSIHSSTGEIVERVVGAAKPGDTILVMSNGGFEGIHQRILDALQEAA
ncbi:MAG: UDP-N-acetylmuramate:L-alanyl-gamma-D-glutamyl-meso-diaminopimelate ligase [bacterium]